MFPSCKTLLVWVYCFECVIHLVESSLSPQPGHIYQEVDLIPGVVNTAYELSVVNGTHSAVQFLLSSDDIDFSRDQLRLLVELRDKIYPPEVCPLLLTVSQGKHVSSFDLPHNFTSKESSIQPSTYHIWAKTICIDVDRIPTAEPFRNKVQISFVASTCSSHSVQFRVILYHYRASLSLRLDGESTNLLVAPTTSTFFRYDWNEDGNAADTIIIKLEAEQDRDRCDEEKCNCMTASVQSLSCPVYDEVSTMRHSGYWQTFSSTAGITVERKELPSGFFLILVTEFEDAVCRNKDGYDSDQPRGVDPTAITRYDKSLQKQKQTIPSGLAREKSVSIRVQKMLSYSEYVWPTFFPLIIYVVVILITFVVYIWFHRENVRRYVTSNKRPVVKSFLRSEKYICSSSHEVDGWKREKLESKSSRYLWLLITVAIFYCIPVFQLIINYLGIVYRTGEQDICYYNNLCSLPLNKIMDFNHIYSNIGYLIFGVLFIVFTLIRQRTMEGRRGFFVFQIKPVCCSLLDTLPRRVEYGTFDQYGIFYSMGFALFMEGFLSASYHICPNKANFQYDTSFMYAMAVLSYVKIYQFRHFLYMNELMAFLLLALVLTCTVFGLFSTSLAYKILLSLVHLGLVIAFQFFLLFISRDRDSQWEEVPTWKQAWNVLLELLGIQTNNDRPNLLLKHHPNKSLLIWSVAWNILLVINSWTLVYGTNFATQVLYILLANLALYVVYYCIMKVIHGEFEGFFSHGIRNPTLGCWIYGFISLLFWIPGLYFFMNPLSTWELSPASSREINESCNLLHFYDNHDIWHLLSAPALFFSFMMFLTIDDGLIGRHHESIPVF
ncbi:SID1 transmembrane family member 1 [Folsomia candida]|uniref:SID1 transmembrane family member 1 n=1 Tax=Folsomia candida TaxID=158441 RepID=UPI000B905E0C|nr:SID1 transmembrane family member 1 [Folsomia candida]